MQKKRWFGTLDAFEHGSRCLGPNGIYEITTDIVGSEDCLFLNVYTPNLNVLTRFAVMFFIHPSLFTSENADSSQFGPEHLVKNNVIVVTVNYRHSVFGFLSSEDEYASGNQGLKDIVMALKWVNKNIAEFKGDPKKVTIFGQSNGAALVNYLMLSDMPDGLFSKAIMESGSALMPCYFQPNPKIQTENLGKRLDFKFNTTKELVEKLKLIDGKKIIMALNPPINMESPFGLRSFDFAPSVESTNSKEPILTEAPIKRLINGNFHKIRIMLGTSNNESMFLNKIISNYSTFYNQNPELIVPVSFGVKDIPQKTTQAMQDLQKMYFDGKSNGTADEWLQLYTDLLFKFPIDRIVRLYSKKSYLPIYYYEFMFDGSLNYYKKNFDLKDFKGATHADELFYLFDTKSTIISADVNFILMRDRMTSLWANFAKDG